MANTKISELRQLAEVGDRVRTVRGADSCGPRNWSVQDIIFNAEGHERPGPQKHDVLDCARIAASSYRIEKSFNRDQVSLLYKNKTTPYQV